MAGKIPSVPRAVATKLLSHNLDEDKMALKVLTADTYDDHIRTNSDNAIEHLNL